MSYSNTAIFIYVKPNKKFQEREEIQAKGKLEQGEGQYSAKRRTGMEAERSLKRQGWYKQREFRLNWGDKHSVS